MIDTGNIILRGNYLNQVNDAGIEWKSATTYEENSLVMRRGKIKNMIIELSYRYLSIKGSISQFIGSNLISYSFAEIIEGYVKLGNIIGVNLLDAEFTRLDLAENIFVNHIPNAYYPSLGPANGLNRFVEKNSLYYNSKNRKLVFYDKRKQSGSDYRRIYGEINCLRFEVRWSNGQLVKLAKKLDLNCLTVMDLKNKEVCVFLIKSWQQSYLDITKIQNHEFNFENISSPKDFSTAMINYAIEALGGRNEMEQILDNISLSPVHKSRIRKSICNQFGKRIVKSKSRLIKELDDKISQVVEERILSLSL